MVKNNPIAVIGAGNWGTSLALLLAGKGEQVVLWGHDSTHIKRVKEERENKKYLPGYHLAENILVTDDLQLAVSQTNCVVMVVPSHAYRGVFSQALPSIKTNAVVVSTVKGIENDSRMTMTQVMADVNSSGKELFLGVLSGPSFADEVAANTPTAITASFKQIAVAERVQQLFSTSFFRVYTSTDVLGLELAGAMKNVIAIAAGISDGLGYGLNTRAALITRGLAEITRMGEAFGADPLTFTGLGGLGDLVLTCTGNLSRNRTVGLKLGQGKTLEMILDEMTMVAEGVKTTRSCYNLAQELAVEMPILEQVYQVIYEDKTCGQAVQELFSRDLKKEQQ